MPDSGGLPSDSGGVGTAFPFGAGVSGLFVPASVAGRVSLSVLRRHPGVAAELGLVAVCELRPQSLGDGRNDRNISPTLVDFTGQSPPRGLPYGGWVRGIVIGRRVTW